MAIYHFEDMIKHATREEAFCILAKLDYLFDFLTLPDSLNNDKEFVIEVLKKAPKYLRKVPMELRNDPEVVYEAVIRNHSCIQFASDYLKTDKTFILMCARDRKGMYEQEILGYVSKSLTDDKDFVNQILSINPYNINAVSERLKNDRDIAMTIAKTGNVGKIPAAFYDDREIILEAVKSKSCLISDFGNGWAILEPYLDDEEIIDALKNCNLRGDSVPKKLSSSKEFVLNANKGRGLFLEQVSRDLKGDKEVVFALVGKDSEAIRVGRGYWDFRFATSKIKGNKEIMLEAIQKIGGRVYRYASKELKADNDIIQATLQSDYPIVLLEYGPAEFNFGDNYEIVAKCVEKDARALGYASEKLRNDVSIFKKAFEREVYYALKYAPENYKSNREFILNAVKMDRCILQFASKELRDDYEVVLAAVNSDGQNLQYASSKMKNNKQIVLDALKHRRGDDEFSFASSKLRADKEFVIEAVKINPKNYKYAAWDLQLDPDVVKAAGLYPLKSNE